MTEERVSGNIFVSVYSEPDREEYVIRNPVTGQGLGLPTRDINPTDLRALADRIEQRRKEVEPPTNEESRSEMVMVQEVDVDKKILELALKKLSEAFDEFVGECYFNDGIPRAPKKQALMKARGYLPPYCSHSFGNKDFLKKTDSSVTSDNRPHLDSDYLRALAAYRGSVTKKESAESPWKSAPGEDGHYWLLDPLHAASEMVVRVTSCPHVGQRFSRPGYSETHSVSDEVFRDFLWLGPIEVPNLV